MSARLWPTYATVALAALIMISGRPAKASADLPAPVSDAELDGSRGGFIAADGIEFNFGALLSTMVNGQLALQTQVTFTPGGPQVTQTTGPNTVQGVSASTGTITGLNLQGYSPSQVALLNNGATALIQKVTGGIQNIVINAASNQNIQQSTQLQLTLPNFAQSQQAFQQNLAALHVLQNTQAALAAVH
jgi:hypothetical protein